MLTGLFERCMKRRGVKESDPYDWEKPTETVKPAVTINIITNNTNLVISRPITCTSYGAENNQLITSTVDNEQNEEPDSKKITSEVFDIFLLNQLKFKNKFILYFLFIGTSTM